MAGRVGMNGEVIIPEHLRDRAGLRPGTEVDFELHGDRVIIVRRAGGRFRGGGMARRLLEDRARERR